MIFYESGVQEAEGFNCLLTLDWKAVSVADLFRVILVVSPDRQFPFLLVSDRHVEFLCEGRQFVDVDTVVGGIKEARTATRLVDRA